MAANFGTNTAGNPVQPCPLQKKERLYWIEIELVDEDGGPIPWQEYRLITSGGEQIKGFLDDKGWSRVDNLEQGGDCRVGFPSLDKDAWQFVESLPAREGREES